MSSIVASEPAACRPILVDFVDTGSNLSSPFPLGLTFGFLPYRRKPATHFRIENSHLESTTTSKDPKGNPGCLRDWVERLPIRPKCINVRALSANEGSGTADWPLVVPLACFPKDEEDIVDSSPGIRPVM